LFSFIESCLRHKSEVVIYEAAAAIVRLPRVTAYVACGMRAFHRDRIRFSCRTELAPAVSVLQLFCSSPKPALRFAAVRTLNKASHVSPV
jgi:coatomer protein complex subunit gamma